MYDTIRIIPSNTCFPDSSALQFQVCRTDKVKEGIDRDGQI